jgi:hypothetical protein
MNYSKLLHLLLFTHITNASPQCETEDDLVLETCTLKDLTDSVLIDICHRIGLDMETHVLPSLYDVNEDEEAGVGDTSIQQPRVYKHEDYVMGAEECLMIEDEMERLAREDPELLDQLEREALQDDPELFAEIIADILTQDKSLLAEIVQKLSQDKPDFVKEMADGMLENGEGLEDRPDIVGYLLASLISEDDSLLDEYDLMFASHFGEFDDEVDELMEDGLGAEEKQEGADAKDEL